MPRQWLLPLERTTVAVGCASCCSAKTKPMHCRGFGCSWWLARWRKRHGFPSLFCAERNKNRPPGDGQLNSAFAMAEETQQKQFVCFLPAFSVSTSRAQTIALAIAYHLVVPNATWLACLGRTTALPPYDARSSRVQIRHFSPFRRYGIGASWPRLQQKHGLQRPSSARKSTAFHKRC